MNPSISASSSCTRAFDTYSRTSLACQRPTRSDALERAVRAARDSDYAVVVVGTSDLVESEGYDRTDLELPDGQNDLVEQILDANPRTVVVVNSGGPVAMPWFACGPSSVAVMVRWTGDGRGRSPTCSMATDAPGGRMPFTVPLRSKTPQPSATSRVRPAP